MRKIFAGSLSLVLLGLFTHCASKPDSAVKETPKNALFDLGTGAQSSITLGDTRTEEIADLEYATYYLVISDTGFDYSTLRSRMFDLHRKLDIPIDTMGRFYNIRKKLIALPDNDEDEMYAGDYFPRRFPSENLSLEYLSFYQKLAGEKTMALVTGIYETEKEADSALVVLHKTEKNAFKIKADIYIGCMH